MTHPHEGVEWFAEEMTETLEANSHKRGWDDIDPAYALGRLREEVQELQDEVRPYELSPESAEASHQRAERIIREATDVANFAMMIAWQYRHKRHPRAMTGWGVLPPDEVRVKLSHMRDHLIEILPYPTIGVFRIRYVNERDPETDRILTRIERDDSGIGGMAAIVVLVDKTEGLGRARVTVPFNLKMLHQGAARDVADMLAPQITEAIDRLLRNADHTTHED